MSFFRTPAGLRISLVVYAVLLIAGVVLLVGDPGGWRTHLVVIPAPLLGFVMIAFRLRAVSRTTPRMVEPEGSEH